MRIHCLAHAKWPLQDLQVPFPCSKTCPGSHYAPTDIEERTHVTVETSPAHQPVLNSASTNTHQSSASINHERYVATSHTEVYTGQMWRGQRDGIGTSLSLNGNAYSGEWCSGRRHGWGFMVKRAGVRYEGTWCGNQVYGFGVLIQLNDLKYMGEFANFQKHGTGVSVHPNGHLTVGYWKCGNILSRAFLFQNTDNGGVVANPTVLPFGPATSSSSSSSSSGSQWQANPSRVSLFYNHFGGLEQAAVTAIGDNGGGIVLPPSTASSTSTLLPVELIKKPHQTTGDQLINETGPVNLLPQSPVRWVARRRENHDDSAPSSSSSRSEPLTPTRTTAEESRDWKVFQVAKAKSNVMAIHKWTPEDIAHLFKCCGVRNDVADYFVNHRVSGEQLFDIASHGLNENLKEMGVLNPYIRRYMIVIISLLLRIRRRCLVESGLAPESGKAGGISSDLLLDFKQLSVERRIGGGGYGKVYKGKCDLIKASTPTQTTRKHGAGGGPRGTNEAVGPNGPSCAIKIFRTKQLDSRRGPGAGCVRLQKQHTLAKELECEAAILSRLRHPNITLMYGVVEYPLGCLVSEYVSCGSLFALLHRHMKFLNLYQIVRLGGEIASAIAYVHSRGILHCDLKSSNILLNEIGNAKVCDFGLANSLRNPFDFPGDENEEVRSLFLGSIGTLHWMAPEVIRGEAYSKASDIYSFGVILWEMFTRKIPYKDLLPTHVTTLAGYAGIGPHDPTADLLRRALHMRPETNTDLTKHHTQLLSHINWESVHMENLEPTPSVMELPDLIANVLLGCLKANPEERPTGLELAAFFNGLAKSDVLTVEENLKTFFGL